MNTTTHYEVNIRVNNTESTRPIWGWLAKDGTVHIGPSTEEKAKFARKREAIDAVPEGFRDCAVQITAPRY